MHWWTDSQYLSQCAGCVFATVVGDIICERCNIGVLSDKPLLGRCACCVCPSVCLEAIKYTQEDHHGRCVVHHGYVFKCSWSRDVCFFWIEMFVWVQVLKSRPIANERIWEGKEKFLSQGRRKEPFDVVETSLSRDGTYWLKGGLNGSSSVKYIFGTIHVMGITTFGYSFGLQEASYFSIGRFLLFCGKGLLENKWLYACHINLFTCTKSQWYRWGSGLVEWRQERAF